MTERPEPSQGDGFGKVDQPSHQVLIKRLGPLPMTVKQLREWIFTNNLDDSWWVAIEGKTRQTVENLETVAMFAASGRPVMVLHVSKASLASPPWVEVDLPPDVYPGRSALGSPVHVKTNFPETRQTVETSQIVLAYILVVLAPVFGLIAGIYLLTKNEVGHGIAAIIISIFLFWFYLGLIEFMSLIPES